MAGNPEKTSKGRGMRWALGLSLALNLLFVGAFAGAAFRHLNQPESGRGGPPSIASYGVPFVRALPREDRFSLIRGIRSEVAGLPNRKERRAAYREMVAVLRTEPFDQARIEEIFVRQGAVAQQVQAYAQGKWLSIVAEMSAAERSVVADRLEQSLRHQRKKQNGGTGQ